MTDARDTENAPQENASPLGPDETQKGPPLPPATFGAFLQGLAGQCLMALGTVENPVTHKRDVDLGQAKYTIDLLQMMEQKTKGNLTDEEDDLLRGLLYDLRMRYVDACRL